MVIHKIISVGNSNCVVMPAAYLREMGLAPGSYVSIALVKNSVLVIAPLERQALLSQVGFINSQIANENRNRPVHKTQERDLPVVHNDNPPLHFEPTQRTPRAVRSGDTAAG